MSNEKQTDSFNWKNKLDALDSLPGEAAGNKNTAWEKLQQKLGEKPRQTKAVWYWAAACLVAMLFFPFLIKKGPVDKLAGNATRQKLLPAPAQINTTIKKETAAVILNLPAKKQSEKKSTKKDLQKQSAVFVDKSNQPLRIDSSEKNKAVEFHSAILLPDSVVATIAVMPAKKKLAVVNINELDAPPEQVYIAQRKKHNNFNIKFGSSKTAGPAAVSRLDNTDRPNIKISLNN